MVPFMPPPPNCAARPLHVDGKATWKFIDLAVGARSTGAMEPFTVQYAGSPLFASIHLGASSVTADTGSPIAEMGILVPSLAAVQSACVIVREVDCAWVRAPAEQNTADATAVKTMRILAFFIMVSAGLRPWAVVRCRRTDLKGAEIGRSS